MISLLLYPNALSVPAFILSSSTNLDIVVDVTRAATKYKNIGNIPDRESTISAMEVYSLYPSDPSISLLEYTSYTGSSKLSNFSLASFSRLSPFSASSIFFLSSKVKFLKYSLLLSAKIFSPFSSCSYISVFLSASCFLPSASRALLSVNFTLPAAIFLYPSSNNNLLLSSCFLPSESSLLP